MSHEHGFDSLIPHDWVAGFSTLLDNWTLIKFTLSIYAPVAQVRGNLNKGEEWWCKSISAHPTANRPAASANSLSLSPVSSRVERLVDNRVMTVQLQSRGTNLPLTMASIDFEYDSRTKDLVS